ncbi:hypothetical protein MIR68_003745 [Amoeboaphelidium protococcarum]|nr:hypothetical protein MIR68_003745 [Amoeboaphelidium protococcarum]
MDNYRSSLIFLSGAAAAWIVFSVIANKQQSNKKSNHQGLSSDLANSKSDRGTLGNIELEQEQLTRNHQFFGQDGMDRIKNSFIVVVGLGGVGSHCAVNLIRSGVQKLRVIDFDQVTLSSLNRHATALRSDVGLPKVQSIKSFARQVFPQCSIDAKVQLFQMDVADQLLAGNPEYVIDCIDNIDTKVDLLRYCYDRGIKVISSMGSAMKIDPTRVRIATLAEVKGDSLAKSVRQKLKKFYPQPQHLERVLDSITVVFSDEKPQVSISSLPTDKPEEAGDYATLPNFRVRTLPVVSPLPSMFGTAIAAHVLAELGGVTVDRAAIEHRPKFYKQLWRDLVESIPKEQQQQLIKISEIDIAFIADECCRGKSVISGCSLGKFKLTRWDDDLPYELGNTLLVLKDEQIERHSLSADQLAKIQSILTKQRQYQ